MRNRSLSNVKWFYGKKRKIGKGNLFLTEKRLRSNEMCCDSDNHNYMCNTMCKRIFRFELQLSSYWLNIKFSRNCPKFHIFTWIVIFQVYLQLFRPNCLIPINFMAGHVRNTLFHYCQLWAVKGILCPYISVLTSDSTLLEYVTRGVFLKLYFA